MFNKSLAFIILFLLSSVLFAETCPNVTAIKSNNITGWKAYDSDEGKPLSKKRLQSFKKNVSDFAMAEWPKEATMKGAIHCFYRDKNGSDLEAYLAKENFSVGSNNKYWYEVSGHLQCAAKANDCDFQQTLAHQPQLAKN